MNLLVNLTPQQLRQAAEIKERIQSLESELDQLLASRSAAPISAASESPQKRTRAAGAKSRRGTSARKGYAVQQTVGARSPKPKANGKMSPAAKAKISASMKELWARRRAAMK